jgi:predicted nucleic acid-binding protein
MPMSVSAKVLVDTSVWIDFFRKVEPHYGVVMHLMADKRICLIGIILAELMQGAKSEKELSVLRDFSSVFPFLPESTKIWQAAGELSFQLRRKGMTLGLSDCYIAVAAREGNAEILTQDRHFEIMKDVAKIRLFSGP